MFLTEGVFYTVREGDSGGNERNTDIEKKKSAQGRFPFNQLAVQEDGLFLRDISG